MTIVVRAIFWSAVSSSLLACLGIGFFAWRTSPNGSIPADSVYLFDNRTAIAWIWTLLAVLLCCAAVALMSGLGLVRRSGREVNGCLQWLGTGILVILAAVVALFAWFSMDRTFVVAHCENGRESAWIAVEELPGNPWTERPRWWVYNGGPSWFTPTGDMIEGPRHGVAHLQRGEYEVTCTNDGTGVLTFGEFSVSIPYPLP